mgnify:FL=1
MNLPRYYKARRIVEEDLNPLRVIEFAMREERLHYQFFKELMELNTDPDGRRMFKRLMSEEERHLELLEAEYEIRKKERPRHRRRQKMEMVAA